MPGVRRLEGCEGTVLFSLTLQVEQLAEQLHEAGADRKDLDDTLRFLQGVRDTKNRDVEQLKVKWIPYLEQRLLQTEGVL